MNRVEIGEHREMLYLVDVPLAEFQSLDAWELVDFILLEQRSDFEDLILKGIKEKLVILLS